MIRFFTVPSCQQLCEVDIIIINLILQMKQLKHKEVKQHVQGHTGNNRESRIRTVSVGFQHLCS